MKIKSLKIFFRWCFMSIIFVVVMAFIATIHYLYTWLKPDFERGQQFDAKKIPYAVILTDRYGNEIFRSFDQHNREWIDLDEIPKDLIDITLIAEDQRFYRHYGIDFAGVFRALYVNIAAGRIKQGASTLTQQLARKVFLTDEQSFERKLKEMAIALGIESKLTKDEIIELYLNVAPYGPTLSGVKGASETYFGKKPNELSLEEILVVVSLPQNPVQLSRKKNIQDWLQCTSPELLLIKNKISDPLRACNPSHLENVLIRYARAYRTNDQRFSEIHQSLSTLQLQAQKPIIEDDFQHWRFYVTQFLAEQNFSLEDYPGGLIIRTSIDQSLQREILTYLRDGVTDKLLEKSNANNIATIALDHDGRSPLVWIGSKDFWDKPSLGQVDMLQSYRQIGSTMKPLVFSAFFDAGYDPSSILWDTRVRFNGQDKIIENADGHYYGAIQADKALASSRNVPAAQAVYLAGGETKIRDYLDTNFGFDINQKYPNHTFGWTIALGTSPVKLSDVSNAYATLATQDYQAICPILSIQTLRGDSVPSPCNETKIKTIDPATSFMISDILGNEYLRDFGDWKQTANVAIKSGTSSKRVNGELFPVDNLMVGYTPKLTIMTWAGNTDGRHLNAGSFGSVSIGSVWEEISLKVIAKYPDKQGPFTPPENLQKVNGQWTRTDRETKKFSIQNMSFVAQENKEKLSLILD